MTPQDRRIALGVIAVAGVLAGGMLWPETAEAQCSMCRRAFDSPEGRQLAAAFRSGILFLLAAPFAAFGVVATLAVRGQRRASRSGSDGG